MPQKRNSSVPKAWDQEMALRCILDASRETVWKAWTDPKQLARWWGPEGFTNPVCRIDLRLNGPLRIDMTGPDGVVYPMEGIFHEIDKPNKLVFSGAALDKKGDPIFEVLITATFEDQGAKTKLVVHAGVAMATAGAGQYLQGMEEGWSQSLDRLAALLAKS